MNNAEVSKDTVDYWQEELAGAMYGEFEHGVKWLNERAIQKFASDYPTLHKWIVEFQQHITEDET